MKQGAFAALCGISQQAVSKHAKAGNLVTGPGGEIDALASLAALEGRLDEAKRTAALAALEGRSTPLRAAAEVRQTPLPRGAKAERDAIERDLKALQLGREAGELVIADEVDAAAREALSALRTAFVNGRRDMAANICATFGVAPDKSAALARFIGQQFELVLGAYARALRQSLDGEDAPPSMEGSALPN